MQVTKAINLERLAEELGAANVSLPRGLGLTGDDLHTYTPDGQRAELAPGAAAVVAAHDATQPAAGQAAATQARQTLRAFWQQSGAAWNALAVEDQADQLRQALRALIVLRAARELD